MEKPDIITWQKTGHYYVGLTIAGGILTLIFSYVRS